MRQPPAGECPESAATVKRLEQNISLYASLT
jgi:hypothetical protein